MVLFTIVPRNSTDPPQEVLGVVDHAENTGLTRQHDLDHTDHTDQEYIYLPDQAENTGLTRQHEVDHTDHTDQEWIYLP